MIGTIDVAVEAKSPNLPLFPMRAFVGSPSSIRVRNVPKRVGDWNINRVYVSVIYPDGTIKQADCVQTGGVWVGTVEGTATSGTCENGYTVFADGTDENGNPVTGYVLGKGDVEILEADGTLSPDPARYYVKLLSAEAAEPREGDMYPTEGGYVIWQNGQANLLGTPFDQITSYVESAVSAKADLSAIPTKTSELSNDSGFITNSSISAFQPYADDEFDTKAFINQWNAETGRYDSFIKSCRLSGEITRDIAVNAFYPIADLYSIKFGTGVTGIGDGALSGFEVLREVYFRNTTKRIGDGAFQNCSQLTRVEFEPITGIYPGPNEISAEALQIGISAFANDLFLYYVRFPSFNKMLIGRDAFANTFKTTNFRSLCPYQGIYFDGLTYTQALLDTYTSSYMPEVSGFCHPWNTVSKEYIDTLHYGKDFSFYEGIDYSYVNRRFSWSIKNKTIYNAHISSLPTGTRSITITQDNVDHAAREMYVDLSSDVTIAATSLFATGAAVDWYLNGELSTFKDEFFKAGTHFVWHFMEYQPNHFMVEKVGAVEADLSAKADKQELSAYVMQNGTAVINSLTCDQLVANQAHIVGYATSSDLSAKRDLTDMTVKGVPQNNNSASWFAIKYGTTTENAWYYDEGRWETGQTLRVLAVPAAIFSLQKMIQEQWTNVGEFTLDNNAEATITYEGVTYTITGYVGNLVVSDELNTRLAALEARIAALEGE